MDGDAIRIRGARANNLKNIDIDIPRDKLVRTQTPQTFRLGNIIAAHEEAKTKGINNSVASCTLIAELGGRDMHIVPGSEKNIKVTTVEDLEILKALMNIKAESWLK